MIRDYIYGNIINRPFPTESVHQADIINSMESNSMEKQASISTEKAATAGSAGAKLPDRYKFDPYEGYGIGSRGW